MRLRSRAHDAHTLPGGMCRRMLLRWKFAHEDAGPTGNLDCDEGEICEGGSGRRKLRFGNIHDGCCRIADEL